MGDEERRTNLTEVLEKYIDEAKRHGETLSDEALERLIFSPQGSNAMDKVKIIHRKEEKESGYEEDFADALELIQEDTAGPSNVNAVAEEVEVYEDAQSYFDPTSVSSPYAVVSPSMRGSLLPLSPDTNFAMHKMSRVSLCSPAAVTPGYFPPPGQGVASSSHPTSVPPPPTSIVHQHSTLHPTHQPPNLPPSHQSPHPPQSYPNGSYHSSGMAGPSYSSHMAPSPYIPSSVPLPPSNGSTPSMNMMSSSISNPLFSPYPQPQSNHPYPLHTSPYVHPPLSNQPYPLHSSPYPPLPFPPSTPMIHHQRTVQAQRTPEEMALFLAQQDQITSRMISQVPPQMGRPLHNPSVHHPHPSHLPHHPQQSHSSHPSHPSQSSSSNRPSRYSSYIQSISSTHPSSTIPSLPPYLSSSASKDLVYQNHQREHEKEEAKEKEKKLMPIERPKLTNDDIIRLVRWRHKNMLAKEQKGERKFTAIADLDQDDISEFNRYLMIMQSKRPEKEGGKYKQDEHGLITVNGMKMRPRKMTFVSAFTLPVGKHISDYVKKKEEDDQPPIIALPSTLKYIPKVPLCAEGKVKPQLCRGHENTKERKENPDLFGGKYMEKIQGLFHSVTGDPRRVPNKSTTGVKWKYPFKDGEAPSGMEVHFNVEGRMWNPEYDYQLVFEQLHEISERVMGFRFELPPEKREKRSASQTRLFEKDLFERDLTKAEEVPEFGNVVEVNARLGRSDYDSNQSDRDDGRIAVGREELIRYEETIKEKKRKEEEELEKALDSDYEDDDEEVGQEKVETPIKKPLDRDLNKKIHPGYYPVMKDGKEWGRISYYERIEEVGKPFKCCKRFPKVFVDPHVEERDETKLERFPLAAIDRLDRDFKTNKILRQPDMTFYFKNKAGGYIILGSDSTPPIFVQSPLYNAMMGEELDTIVRITKGHEMIIYDENFFNYLLHQAYQYGHKTLYEMKQMLLTRVSTTKGWGEAYQKSTILDALVWIEFSVSNGMKKLDTLLTSNYSKLRR